MRRILSFSLIQIIIISIIGCSNISDNKKDFIFGTEYVKISIDYYSPTWGFLINVASTDPAPKFEIVHLKGENIEYINNIELTDETFDFAKTINYNGFYLKMIGVKIYSPIKDIRITLTGMVLKCNEKDYDLNFKNIITINNNSYNIEALSLFGPMNIVLESILNDNSYSFNGHVHDSLSITSFYFDNFIKFDNCILYVNNEYIGPISSNIPYDFKANDTFTIITSIKPETINEINKYDFITSSANIEFIYNKNKKGKTTFPVNVQGVTTKKECEGVLIEIVESS